MKFRKTLTSIVLALTLGGYGCSAKPDRLLYDGDIGGKRVVYYDGDWNSPDRMEIYSDGQLQIVIEDFNENGIIGDVFKDKYILYIGENKKITYGKSLVVDENGVQFHGDDEISKKAVEVGYQRLVEATKFYLDMKNKISQKLEEKLK